MVVSSKVLFTSLFSFIVVCNSFWLQLLSQHHVSIVTSFALSSMKDPRLSMKRIAFEPDWTTTKFKPVKRHHELYMTGTLDKAATRSSESDISSTIKANDVSTNTRDNRKNSKVETKSSTSPSFRERVTTSSLASAAAVATAAGT
jgi:hypothetical protein